jgi:hypothetical protein
MKTTKDPSTPISECQRKIQPLIQQNDEGKYHIPQDLMLKHLPQEVIDSFLDFINQLPIELHSTLLEQIKSGKIQIVCE